jgi:HAD superfamily hydrolase (TIGR01490 family)
MKFIIFDLDDTLLCGDCEKFWFNFMIQKGLLKEDNHISKINQFDEEYRNGSLNFDEYSSYVQQPLTGLSEKKVSSFLDEFIPQVIDKLSDELTEELILESKLADKVLIASGSHDFLVKGFANHFEIESSIGTPVEIKNNIFTGNLAGEPTFKKGKVRAVEKWCLENNFKISDSIFYSDSINDLPMFEVCGEPIVVNPDKILKEIAIKRSYEIIER